MWTERSAGRQVFLRASSMFVTGWVLCFRREPSFPSYVHPSCLSTSPAIILVHKKKSTIKYPPKIQNSEDVQVLVLALLIAELVHTNNTAAAAVTLCPAASHIALSMSPFFISNNHDRSWFLTCSQQQQYYTLCVIGLSVRLWERAMIRVSTTLGVHADTAVSFIMTFHRCLY